MLVRERLCSLLSGVLGASREEAYRGYGEEPQKGAADNIFAREWPPGAGVGALWAVVAHHKVFVCGECVGGVLAVAEVRNVGLINLMYGAALVLYGDGATAQIDRFAREADDTFDKKLAWIAWILKYNDFAALGFCKTVGELVDDKVLAVEERRVHRGAGYNEGLRDKKAYREDDERGDDYKLEEFGEKVLTSLRWHADIVCSIENDASLSVGVELFLIH